MDTITRARITSPQASQGKICKKKITLLIYKIFYISLVQVSLVIKASFNID